jgi:hypothetical protein
MTMTTISTFVDNSLQFRSEVGNLNSISKPDMEVEYCTILQTGKYQVRLLHESVGIGMSDKYHYSTVLELYKNGEYHTDQIADLLWINLPIDTNESINKVIKWIYSNA